MLNVSERRSAFGQLYQIRKTADLLKCSLLLKIVFEGNDIGGAFASQKLAYCLKNFAVSRIGKMLGFQNVGNFFIKLIICQQRSDKSLFRLNIFR